MKLVWSQKQSPCKLQSRFEPARLHTFRTATQAGLSLGTSQGTLLHKWLGCLFDELGQSYVPLWESANIVSAERYLHLKFSSLILGQTLTCLSTPTIFFKLKVSEPLLVILEKNICKKQKEKQSSNENNVSKCSLYVFTIIPPQLTDPCNFITVLSVTQEPEQTNAFVLKCCV